MQHEADPRGDSRERPTVASAFVERCAYSAPPFSLVPVKGIAVKDFVPVHVGAVGGSPAGKKAGGRSSLTKVKKACCFEPGVADTPTVRRSSPEFRRPPREDNDQSSSVLTRYLQFPSDGSILTESSAFPERSRQEARVSHRRRDRASSSRTPEVGVGGGSSSARPEPSSSESRRCPLAEQRLRPSACRQQKRRRVRVSSSSRSDYYEDDLLIARLEDHAACAKLSLSELRGPAGKLRTSDMFVGGGRRCRSADVAELARNVVIWVLVLSGTATIMFGAVGTIVLRTGSVMFLSSALGSALTTVGVLMAIYCTDASSDRGLQRMINHKYNYT
ncbi:hypothetical protein V5799_021252 [Amblyomma americanum]|uniref:Uncharacterized protein n=1 Tax=Amblyomma americanum TaxID=6943 RepID=A0AAQ4FQI0_AMBAM